MKRGTGRPFNGRRRLCQASVSSSPMHARGPGRSRAMTPSIPARTLRGMRLAEGDIIFFSPLCAGGEYARHAQTAGLRPLTAQGMQRQRQRIEAVLNQIAPMRPALKPDLSSPAAKARYIRAPLPPSSTQKWFNSAYVRRRTISLLKSCAVDHREHDVLLTYDEVDWLPFCKSQGVLSPHRRASDASPSHYRSVLIACRQRPRS